MGESAKSLLALVIIVGVLVSAIALTDGQFYWPVDIGVTAATALCVLALLWSMFRRDKAPDFLRQAFGGYYERAGFTFACALHQRGELLYLAIYFQNRYERACRAQVILQAKEGFAFLRRTVESLVIPIECEGGAFGVSLVPWGIPHSRQGTVQTLEVAAYVEYPYGRGKMLRFRDGANVGNATVDAWKTVGTVIAAMGGTIVIHRPAQLRLTLPVGVATEIDGDARITSQTLWRPGSPERRIEELRKAIPL